MLTPQRRYEAYLAGSHQFDGNLTPEQRHRELYEFQLAARMFKPLNKVMASRFAPAKGLCLVEVVQLG